MSEVVDDDERVDPDRRAPEPAPASLLPAPAINLHPIFQRFRQLARRVPEIPRLRNDVAALKQANTRLEEQLAERVPEVGGVRQELQEHERDLRDWNEELEALRERVARLKREMGGTEEYKDVEPQPNTIFRRRPLSPETIDAIAMFLAGSNAFRTLAAFNVAFKDVHRITHPTLYETVVLAGAFFEK